MLTQTLATPEISTAFHARTDDRSRARSCAADHQEASDERLVERIAGGDRAAMEVLYSRHHVRIYRFLVRLTGNATTAEDLVSDTFLDAWRSAEHFEKKSRVSTWLLAIARYKALSELRRRPSVPLDERADAVQDSTDDPETTAHKTGRSAIVRKCLAQLSPARQIDRRSRSNRLHFAEHRQDSHVLCAQQDGRTPAGSRRCRSVTSVQFQARYLLLRGR
jgi:RNA polymerase sigma factor (sigma-70 family)